MNIFFYILNFLPSSTFIKMYLKRYAYGNTNGEMLWNTVDEVLKKLKKKLNTKHNFHLIIQGCQS